MTKACIHFGHHNHLVSPRVCRDTLDNTRSLIGQEVSKTSIAKTSSIALDASKEFHSSFLLHGNNNVNGNGPNGHH